MNESTSSGASQAYCGAIPPEARAKARMASNDRKNAAAATPTTTTAMARTTATRPRRSSASVNTTAEAAGAGGVELGIGHLHRGLSAFLAGLPDGPLPVEPGKRRLGGLGVTGRRADLVGGLAVPLAPVGWGGALTA
jgi:hypothetical protein